MSSSRPLLGPWARRALLVALAAAAALALRAPGAPADTTPYVIQGDENHNTITVSVEFDIVLNQTVVVFCIDDFCATGEAIDVMDTLDISGHGGNDTIIINLVDGTLQDLDVLVHGGTGANELVICATGCPASGVVSTIYRPGPGTQEGEMVQASQTASGDPVLDARIVFDGIRRVVDRAPGTTHVVGTPADDAVTYGDGTDGPSHGRVTVGALTPYEFSGKSALGLDGAEGGDRMALGHSGTPDGLTGDCGTSDPICASGGSSGDDRLIVTGAPGQTDDVVLRPAGEAAGGLRGFAASPRVSYTGIDGIEAALQYGAADGDSLEVAGSPEGDLLVVTPRAVPGAVDVEGVMRRLGGAPFPLPALAVVGANQTSSGVLVMSGNGGADELVQRGGPRNDALSLAPDPGPHDDTLRHSAEGQLLHVVHTTGFSKYVLEGGDGDDVLQASGDVAVPTVWRGGGGADTLAFDRVGGGTVDVSLDQRSVSQAGAGGVVTSAVETLDVRAAAGSVAVAGGAAADTVRYTPTGPNAGRLARDGDGMAVQVSGVAGVLSLDGLGGSDLVAVNGTSAADDVPVARDQATNSLTVAVGGYLPLRTLAGTEAAEVDGLQGQDRFVVSGSGGGPASLTVRGGPDPGADTLDMTRVSPDGAGGLLGARVRFGATPDAGMVETAAPPVGFAGIERVDLEGRPGAGAVLDVHGSGAPNSLTQEANQVRVDGGALVAFTGFSRLGLHGEAGADQLVLNPLTTAGVADMTADAGEGADVLTVGGTALGDTLGYRPTGTAAGAATVGSGPPVSFASVEFVVADGRTTAPSGDLLAVDANGVHGTQVLVPGTTSDSGTIEFRDGTGGTFTGPPLSFGRLGAGTVRLTDGSGTDTLVYRGTTGVDVFSVGPSAGQGSIRLNTQVPVLTQGVATLVLESLDGEDTFNVAGDHPYPGQGAPAVVLDGGNPATRDTLHLAAAGHAVTADFAARTLVSAGFGAVRVVGVEVGQVAAADRIDVAGTSGPDVLRYAPTGAQAGTVSRSGDALELRFVGLVGALRADAGAGADRIDVAGTSSADAAAIVRGPQTEVAVAPLKPLLLPDATEALQLLAADGADVTTVSGAGGPANLTVVGGGPTASPGDELVLEAATVTVAYDSVPTNGRANSPTGDVQFVETEALDLRGGGTGILTVEGTNGADSVSTGSAGPAQVQVNNGTVARHTGYTRLVLDGRGGDDRIGVGHAELADVASLHVIGGSSLADELAVSDRSGVTSTIAVTPTASDAGGLAASTSPASITFESTESLVADGAGGGDELALVTPAGTQDVWVRPGADGQAGSLLVASLVPVRFERLGDGRVRVADAAGDRADRVTADALGTSDLVTVHGPTGVVTTNTRVPLLPESAARLVLNGLDGDDRFEVEGPLPFTLRTDGSGPDRADAVALKGAAADVVTDLFVGTVAGYGGTVELAGIEVLATDVGGRKLTEIGTPKDNTMCYDAAGLNEGQAYVMGAPGSGSVSTTCAPDQRGANLLHSFTAVAQLVMDPSGGVDQVIVNGTAATDLVTAHLTWPHAEVTVHPNAPDPATFRLPVRVSVASTESLVVASDNGADQIRVTAFDNPAPTVFVDAEDPSSKLVGDTLEVYDGTDGRAKYRNVTGRQAGTGTVFVEYRVGNKTSNTQRIDYANVEKVTLYHNS